MRKFYVINVENLNQFLVQPRHILTLRIISFLIRKHDGLPINEGRCRRVMTLMDDKKIKRTVIYSLFKLGFKRCQIANLCAIKYSTVCKNLKAAESSREIRSHFLTIKDGISEVYI